MRQKYIIIMIGPEIEGSSLQQVWIARTPLRWIGTFARNGALLSRTEDLK